jgi:hypothetical protein
VNTGFISKRIEMQQSELTSEARDYIGASVIGSDCWRRIWYEYRGEKGDGVTAKTRRTWDIGKNLEGLILDWIEGSGFVIERKWIGLISKDMQFFRGNIDSLLMKDGKPEAIIEIKTAKDSSFNLFVKKGVKDWNPQYYAQVQSYMGMSNIHKAYIVVLNKDNSEIFDEMVLFDKDFYEELENKASLIASSEMPPPKINSSPLWYQCKMCKFNKVCHD